MPNVECVSEDSVTQWIERLRQGDRHAGDLLLLRYGERLAHAARRRFTTALTPAADEHDLVQSVFCALWKAASEGALEPVQGRDSFWWLLLKIARNKAISRKRKAKALKRLSPQMHGRTELRSPHYQDASNHSGAETRDMVQAFLAEQEQLFAILADESERAVAAFKLEGFNHPEIAAKMGVSVRTVERKAAIVREKWLKYAQSSEEGLAGDDS